MKIYPTSSVPASWDVVATVDLSAATVRIQVGDTWHDATWVSASTAVPGGFQRTARLTIGGAEANSADAKAMVSTEPLVEVTVGTAVLVDKSSERLEVQ